MAPACRWATRSKPRILPMDGRYPSAFPPPRGMRYPSGGVSTRHRGGADSMTRRDLLKQAAGAAALASANQLFAQTPEPPRIRDSFDFGWIFSKGDIPGAQQPGFSDSAWRSLALPHDWSVEGPFAQTEPSGGAGGFAPTGVAWYRKRFRLPASYKDHKVSVEFD